MWLSALDRVSLSRWLLVAARLLSVSAGPRGAGLGTGVTLTHSSCSASIGWVSSDARHAA